MSQHMGRGFNIPLTTVQATNRRFLCRILGDINPVWRQIKTGTIMFQNSKGETYAITPDGRMYLFGRGSKLVNLAFL